jgi:hypothetical protein
MIDMFAKIDNDKSVVSRSSLAKGVRYSQRMSLTGSLDRASVSMFDRS